MIAPKTAAILVSMAVRTAAPVKVAVGATGVRLELELEVGCVESPETEAEEDALTVMDQPFELVITAEVASTVVLLLAG